MSEPTDSEQRAFEAHIAFQRIGLSIGEALSSHWSTQFGADVRALIDGACQNPEATYLPIGPAKRIARVVGFQAMANAVSAASLHFRREYRVERREDIAEEEQRKQRDFLNDELAIKFLNGTLDHIRAGENPRDARSKAAEKVWETVLEWWPDDSAQQRRWYPTVDERTLRNRFNALAKQHLDSEFLRNENSDKSPRHSITDLALKPGAPRFGKAEPKSAKIGSV